MLSTSFRFLLRSSDILNPVKRSVLVSFLICKLVRANVGPLRPRYVSEARNNGSHVRSCAGCAILIIRLNGRLRRVRVVSARAPIWVSSVVMLRLLDALTCIVRAPMNRLTKFLILVCR